MTKAVNFLLTGIKIGVILILLTPLVLGPFGLSLSNYPKTVFFRTLIEIIFIFYLLLIFFDSQYLPRISSLVLVVSIFVGVQFLTGLTGFNFYRSFFGDLHRVEGLILHLHLLAFFLILISIFKRKEDWFLFFKITVVISALSSLAGILQKLGIFKFYGLDPLRISGTWTNPDFFAPYIALTIFLAIFLFADEKDKNWKALWVSILLLNCFTLILSGTRASWIGFGIGLIFLISFWLSGFSKPKKKIRLAVLFGILALSILSLFLILNQGHPFLTKNLLFQRAISILNPSTLLTNSRLPVWQIAFQAWKERPIFGWGVESFSYIFDKYFKASYLQYIPKKIHFDRPHNKILELMATTGLLGTLSYLLIFFVVFYLLNKFRKEKPIFSLVLSAFFVAYFVQNLFCFDTIGTYLLFFLVSGFVNNNFLPVSPTGGPPAKTKTISGPKFLKLISIWPLIFLCLMAFYYLNVKPTLACRAFVKAVGEEKNLNKALLEYQKGVSQNTIFDDDLREELAIRLISILDNVKLQDQAKKEILKILKEQKPFLEKQLGKPDRRYLDPYQLLALINERVYLIEGDSDALKKMEEVSRKALDFNPEKSDFYLILGRAKLFQKNYSEGEANFQKYFEFSSGGLSGQFELYRLLAATYYQVGEKTKAAENFKKALDINFLLVKLNPDIPPKEIEVTLNFARGVALIYYQEFNDKEIALEVYQKSKEIFPEYIEQYQFPVTD